jgi:NAD(P)-dependent dehydrogenase (short-subunit alcohol dehydrogenase family)
VAVACNVTDEASVTAALEKVTAELGIVDILVNGAVVYQVQGVLEMTLEGWRRQLSVMLDGAFLFTKKVAAALVADGRPGSIINVISTAGHQGEPSNIGYTTAKGGLLNMTRSAAMELAPYGIRVNSITPTATDITEAADRMERWGLPPLDEALLGSIAEATRQAPLGRLPGPSDYGRGVVFLVSDAAALITGSDLRVDAGTLAMYWRRKPPGGP